MFKERVNHLPKSVLRAVGFPTDPSQLIYHRVCVKTQMHCDHVMLSATEIKISRMIHWQGRNVLEMGEQNNYLFMANICILDAPKRPLHSHLPNC